MKNNHPHVLFCENPFDSKKVDEDFEEQYNAAIQAGFKTLLFSFDDWVSGISPEKILSRIPDSDTVIPTIYRGWMLSVAQYEILYVTLKSKNYLLINDPEAYKHCHFLPENLTVIEEFTPKTIYRKIGDDNDLELLIKEADIFGTQAVILKDFVKSEKHHWETACFVPNASDKNKLRTSMQELRFLRGSAFNEGICVREFIPLKHLTIHSKSGMPLTEEYRLFFVNGQLLDCFSYWEEGEYPHIQPDISMFEVLSTRVKSAFFSMDIACKQDGTWIIIELGDGQVAGLPDAADANQFYTRLLNVLEQS